MLMSRSNLVEALKAVKWDSPIEVFIGTMDEPTAQWPAEFVNDSSKSSVRMSANSRRIDGEDFISAFIQEVKNDLVLLSRHDWASRGCTKYGLFFFRVPIPNHPNMVQYAKITNGRPD